MRPATPMHFATRLVVAFAAFASLLIISAPEADANVFACPGVHNVDLSIERHGYWTTYADPEWPNPASYYEAAFCSDIIGIDVRDAYGVSVKRHEWHAIELVQLLEEAPGVVLPLVGTKDTTFYAEHGCEFTAVLFTRPPGDQHVDSFKYTETYEFDQWGRPGCFRLTDLARPGPKLSFAPVVSTNPPSIDP